MLNGLHLKVSCAKNLDEPRDRWDRWDRWDRYARIDTPVLGDDVTDTSSCGDCWLVAV